MAGAYQQPLDIANRALQHCGVRSIVSFTENSKAAIEIAKVYDKVRRAELERNRWICTVKKATLYPLSFTSMLMVPPVFDATVAYQAGAIVSYTDIYGDTNTWYSRTGGNVNQTPTTPGAPWAPFFGSLLVQQFIPQTSGITPPAFNAGDIVYMPLAPGKNALYLSLFNNNSEVPNVPDAWTAYVSPFLNDSLYPQNLSTAGQIVGQYNKGQIVQGSDGYFYMSLININQNNDPTLGSFPWNQFTTYASGALVAGIDGYIYESLVNSNLGNQPTTDAGTNWENLSQFVPWTPAFSADVSSTLWLPIHNGALQAPNIVWPLGSGPVEQTFTKNVFRLPENFLRRAPQDPTLGKVDWLGAPSGLAPDDWEEEGDYMTSRFPAPIMLRYCADVVDVREMTAMLCEGIAARIAIEICEPLTQSSEKLAKIGAAYDRFMDEARTINAIETGPEMPPVDPYIVCRL